MATAQNQSTSDESASEQQKAVVNIAAYLFVKLDRLSERRKELRHLCKKLQMKGTILLSPEGINIFLAGTRHSVDEFLKQLRSDPLLETLEVKESFSQTVPFSRMLVKLKKEIIAFGVDGIEPQRYSSKRLSAKELKKWLDEGRPVTLLDTRNDYEVKLGTFENAHIIGVDHFRDFPEAVRQLPEEMKNQPIVTFCTGGIRCEKAGPFMEMAGFEDIYQLEGGILKYFEECGETHYEGDCFVFDYRVAVDPALNETEATQCYACQIPLTAQEQQSGKYILGVCCPYCWEENSPPAPPTIAQREQAIRDVTTFLPGSVAYTNERPLNVPQKYEGRLLIDFICDYHPHVSRPDWEKVCEEGLIRDRERVIGANEKVRAGQRLMRFIPETIEPAVNADLKIISWEEPLIVFNKPAPLPIHPCGRFNKNSMTQILDLAFPDEKLRPAHRLDANTTGLILFTNHRDVSQDLHKQFERGQAKKTYLCIIHGQPDWNNYRCDLPISRQASRAGTRTIDEQNGQPAQTQFNVLQRNEDGTSLLEAIPITGRTNQIRVHLWRLGYPIVGDPAYLPNNQQGKSQTLSVDSPPMVLHSWKITIEHPVLKEAVSYQTPRPDWA